MMDHLPGLELRPRNVFCIGRNYAEHAKELGNAVPTEPVVFLKPVSALCAEGTDLVLPARSTRVDHEVELVVAIGGGGRNIPESEALSHVAGYTIGIDLTARDLQDEAKKKGLPWSVAKGFDTFAPLAEFVDPERVMDPQALELVLEVNGLVRQRGSTSDMLFSVARLISYLSTIFTLSPGDLIFTGTPSGVAPLSAGDRVVARLEPGVVSLRAKIVAG